MALSKQNYVEIAKIFAHQRGLKRDPRRVQMMDILAFALADYFAKDNAKFDRARFLKACKEEITNV